MSRSQDVDTTRTIEESWNQIFFAELRRGQLNREWGT